jgi:hypothetical protein
VSTFRLRDAFRDLLRVPRLAALVIAVVLASCIAPLVVYTLGASRHIAEAADGRAAFNAYAIWCAIAIPLGAVASRLAAAAIASAMVARREPANVPFAVVVARILAHGVPALLAALAGVALAALGLLVAAAAALPVAAGEEIVRAHASGAPTIAVAVLATALALAVFVAAFAAAAWLAALTLPAGPAAAAEQLPPSAALRRGAALARPAHVRLALWIAGLLVVALAPLGVARLAVYDATGKKPPVAPVLRAMQIHGWIVVAIAVVAALAQVAIYRRLRDTRA